MFAHLLIATSLCCGALNPAGARREISLDGTWEIAEGTRDEIPRRFDRKIPVPGLADMAVPRFDRIGRGLAPNNKQERGGFLWYRRTFAIEGSIPERVMLKINKAKYGIRVIINGQVVGEHYPCFTPAWFDVRKHLRPAGQENEMIVRVGAHWSSVPPSVVRGIDKEKKIYMPGIYDSVKLVLTDGPMIRNVQIVPDIDRHGARVMVYMDESFAPGKIDLTYCIREVKSQQKVAEGKVAGNVAKLGKASVDVFAKISDCRLWSPEDPFLYELEVLSQGDGVSTRFGMRTFRMDPQTGRAVLNGKPYFMRGSNVCILRFFEDKDRED